MEQITEEEWRKRLTREQYEVLRGKGTERPFTGRYVHTKEDGVYRCAACGNELFRSDTKFDRAPAGRASPSRPTARTWSCTRTRATGWSALR